MRTIAVVGKNYGDEGKGLVTASLCSSFKKPLIIKHNGGAQAGHTVENEERGTRFVHHQIGSGAEYGADTLFAETYYPDLYQIRKEIEEFKSIFRYLPRIYGEEGCCVTTVDDILINMAIETKRGKDRHGSCGMGINECSERISAGYKITLKQIADSSYDELRNLLVNIRKEYTHKRIIELEISEQNPYYSMILDENILYNFAVEIKDNSRFIELVSADSTWLKRYDGLIFESGQGLLLDKDYTANAPHLTSSKTGITEPLKFLNKRSLGLQEAIYVTRTYVTKHGAGPLSHEFKTSDWADLEMDMTNLPNEWQGDIRYASHGSTYDFLLPVANDIKDINIKPSLAITHMNETGGKILFENDSLDLKNLREMYGDRLQNIYISQNRYGIEKYF